MIEPAPNDFWQQVINRVAKLIYDREVSNHAMLRVVEKEPEKKHETRSIDQRV